MTFPATSPHALANPPAHDARTSLTDRQIDILRHVSAAHVAPCDLSARNRRRIETVLNRIRPMLRADGLDVDLVDVEGRDANVHLSGVSSTGWCPAAPLNFHTDLDCVLRREIVRFGRLRLV